MNEDEDVTLANDDSSDDEVITLTEEQYNELKQLEASLQDALDHSISAALTEKIQMLLVDVSAKIQKYEGRNIGVAASEDSVEIADDDDNNSVWPIDDAEFIDDAQDETVATAESTVPATQPAATTTAAKPVVTVAQPAAAAATAAAVKAAVPTMKYAPNIEPIKGTFSIVGIAIVYTTPGGTDINSVRNAVKYVQSDYKWLSNGALNYVPTAKAIKVTYPHNAGKLNAAVSQAKSKAGNFDRYELATGNLGVSHSGGDTSLVRNALKRDWVHEQGHVLEGTVRPNRRVLGHAGKYVTDSKGKQVLDAYGDGSSFMGRFSTNRINPAQRYFCGWAGKNKTAQYDLGVDGTKTFSMEPDLLKKPNPDNVTGIFIPAVNGGRDMFVSIIPVDKKQCFAFHYMTGGGTQRLKVWNKSADIPEVGLTFTRLSATDGTAVLEVKPLTTASAKLKASA